MDEFAQTRGADDLFDDEIIPVTPEQIAEAQSQAQILDVPQVDDSVRNESEPEHQPQPVDKLDTAPRSRGGDGGRTRGRGGGRGARGARGPRRAEGPSRHNPPDAENGNADQPKTTDEVINGKPNEENTLPPNGEDAATDAIPATGNGQEATRVPAVRGDRSATGGVKKPKLTEEELAERMAAAKLRAAEKAAAHARAEADHVSFLEREKVAAEKRKQEFQNRRAMDSEREKNRQRKMDALTGREWDATKQEEDYNPRGGRSQFRRGMHGGVSGYTRNELGGDRAGEDPATVEIQSPVRGRGRGRGGRGGRGRGGSRGPRGEGYDVATSETKPAAVAPVVNNDADFPSLPTITKKETDSSLKSPIPDLHSPASPASESWAAQVESALE